MTDAANVQAQLDQLSAQQALQTQALRAALEARWQGQADSVDGYVQALDPTITTQPKTPLYAT